MLHARNRDRDSIAIPISIPASKGTDGLGRDHSPMRFERERCALVGKLTTIVLTAYHGPVPFAR